MRTINRAWLMRQVDAGKMEARCTLRLTDDYTFDTAYNYGKTGWMPARIRRPVFKEMALPNGNVIEYSVNDDFTDDQMNLQEYHFTGKSGGAYRNEDGTIHLRVHSNLHYELRKVKP